MLVPHSATAVRESRTFVLVASTRRSEHNEPVGRIVVLLLSLLLASCAAQAAPSAAPTATSFPCPFSAATPNPYAVPTALEVVRPYNALLDLPAFSHCVLDAARVKRLYTAILALPARAPGNYACPKSWDVRYSMTFLIGVNVVRIVTLEADGCEFLYLSKTDIRSTDNVFLQQFADTLGLRMAQAFSPFQRT